MTQHAYTIADQPGLAFLADVNAALAAIVTNNSGTEAPVETYAHMWWADTTAGILKRRNAGNTDWISVMSLDLAISDFGESLITAADAAAVRILLDAAQDSGLIHTIGNETKSGVLTFMNSPVVPAATTAGQAVNKGQLDAFVTPKYLSGFAITAAGASSTITVAPGYAASSDDTMMMRLASAMSKTTSAWAVGSGNGGLDTGTIANNATYHFHEVIRPDTGVVDVAISLSPTAPTTGGNIPSAYTKNRRFASWRTDGSAQWVKGYSSGDRFYLDSIVNDVNATNPGATAVTRTLSVPTGINVDALIIASLAIGTAASSLYVSDLATADITPSASAASQITNQLNNQVGNCPITVRTNTSGQIRTRLLGSDASTILRVNTQGWVDTRGRDA